MSGCLHGICKAPNNCECFNGYRKEDNEKYSFDRFGSKFILIVVLPTDALQSAPIAWTVIVYLRKTAAAIMVTFGMLQYYNVIQFVRWIAVVVIAWLLINVNAFMDTQWMRVKGNFCISAGRLCYYCVKFGNIRKYNPQLQGSFLRTVSSMGYNSKLI